MQILENTRYRLAITFKPTKGVLAFSVLAGLSGAITLFGLLAAIPWVAWFGLVSAVACAVEAFVTAKGRRDITLDAPSGEVLMVWGLPTKDKRLSLADITRATTKASKMDVPFHYNTAYGSVLLFDTAYGPQQIFDGMLPAQEADRAAEVINAWLNQRRG